MQTRVQCAHTDKVALQDTGTTHSVVLSRMESAKLADKRSLFETFTSIKVSMSARETLGYGTVKVLAICASLFSAFSGACMMYAIAARFDSTSKLSFDGIHSCAPCPAYCILTRMPALKTNKGTPGSCWSISMCMHACMNTCVHVRTNVCMKAA
jgi:hypothetical protein